MMMDLAMGFFAGYGIMSFGKDCYKLWRAFHD